MKKLNLPLCPCCGEVCPVSLMLWVMLLPAEERDQACMALQRTALEQLDD